MISFLSFNVHFYFRFSLFFVAKQQLMKTCKLYQCSSQGDKIEQLKLERLANRNAND